MRTSRTDAHWAPKGTLAADRNRRRALRVTTTSRRILMRDGAQIAIDLHLPSGPHVRSRMPAIIRQTRYFRSLRPRPSLAWLGMKHLFDLNAETRRTFLAAGYAWVDVDVRGTGASSGTWHGPWFEDQIRDGAALVDWIVAQEWSDGRVGSLGISHDGTTAETLLVNRHPAIRAVAPLFSLHDVYTDVAFPGGVHLAWFTEAWSRYNELLDRNAFGDAMTAPLRIMARVASTSPRPTSIERVIARFGNLEAPRAAKIVSALIGATIEGVAHIDGEAHPTGEELRERIENLDVHAGALKIVFRDDKGLHPQFPEQTIDSLSPHARVHDLVGSKAAIYGYSGWRDAAYQSGAIRRWTSVPNAGSRLTLGPWAHTGKLRIHAFDLGAPTCFSHAAELLDFFDTEVRGIPSAGDRAPIHYFVTGREEWRSAHAWPPPGVEEQTFHLGARGRLSSTPTQAGREVRSIDARTGTGERSRWRSLLGLVPGDYPDRRERDRSMHVFESERLEREIVFAGSPRVTLHMSFEVPAAARAFVYLEDVAPNGGVSYVTEGQLAAIHRARKPDGTRTFERRDGLEVGADEPLELTFDLYAMSHAFLRGHAIRLAVAATDTDHFASSGASGAFSVHYGGDAASRLVLPVFAPGA